MPSTAVRTHEEAVLQERSSRPRLFQLDALRGVAAFTVLWHHLRLSYTLEPARNPLVSLLASGHQAVILFFLLSGYVLGLQVWQGKQRSYPRYLLRRFFRIYVPYLAALLLAWACASHFLYSRLPLTSWFYQTWQTPLTVRLFLKQLLISIRPTINTAFWSLRLEVEFSILLPLLCWLIRRLPAVGVVVLCGVSYWFGIHATNLNLYARLLYYPVFVLGLLLSFQAGPLETRFRLLAAPVRHGLFGLAVCGYALYFRAGSYGDALVTACCCVVLLYALTSAGFSRVLRHTVPEYLGRISYSLYLVHGTVLFAFLNLLYGRMRLLPFALLYGACSLGLAHVFCVFVEERAMRFGARLTATPRLARTAT